MIELIQERIDRLKDVGQHAFNGTDYSFGFNTWRSGTITLLRRILPDELGVIEVIQNIVLRRVNYNKTDSSGYNLDSCKNEAREVLHVLIHTLNQTSIGNQMDGSSDFWNLLHPRVVQLARHRFINDFYADSVSICLREINSIVKNHVRQVINMELDGAPLMTRAFSANNPIIAFADLTTENGRNIQLGYMKIFEGAMIGIRNPKANENLYPDKIKSIHLLFIASFMFMKLQEAGLIYEE